MGKNKKIVMTIAGSDSSGGAGIQADLKAFTVLGLHGVTVLTCITAQNTQKVEAIQKIPTNIIKSQIDILVKDIPPVAVKTGMLYDKEIVKIIAKKIKQHNLRVVVDPVMVATSNDSLSNKDITDAINKDLLPVAYIITPNIFEASMLADTKICNVDDAKVACKKIFETGAKNVLIKGGHLEGGYVDDVFYDGKKFSVFSLPRIPDKKAHGSGCTLSALITGHLALGDSPLTSVKKSKNILWNMINEGYKPGKGSDVLNFDLSTVTNAPICSDNACFNVWFSLNESVNDLIDFLPREYIAEVGMNFAYALENAKKFDQVCAINGRITKTKEKPIRCGSLDFGCSKHVASIILAAMSFDKKIRSAVNIRYSKKLINKCAKLGFNVGMFSRFNEPANVKSTMEWGTKNVIDQLGFVPDIIFDNGGIGKEPMIRVLGENPDVVVKKLRKIIEKDD